MGTPEPAGRPLCCGADMPRCYVGGPGVASGPGPARASGCLPVDRSWPAGADGALVDRGSAGGPPRWPLDAADGVPVDRSWPAAADGALVDRGSAGGPPRWPLDAADDAPVDRPRPGEP